MEATYEVICLNKNANTNHFGHLYLEQEKARKLLGNLKEYQDFKKIYYSGESQFPKPTSRLFADSKQS